MLRKQNNFPIYQPAYINNNRDLYKSRAKRLLNHFVSMRLDCFTLSKFFAEVKRKEKEIKETVYKLRMKTACKYI